MEPNFKNKFFFERGGDEWNARPSSGPASIRPPPPVSAESRRKTVARVEDRVSRVEGRATIIVVVRVEVAAQKHRRISVSACHSAVLP